MTQDWEGTHFATQIRNYIIVLVVIQLSPKGLEVGHHILGKVISKLRMSSPSLCAATITEHILL